MKKIITLLLAASLICSCGKAPKAYNSPNIPNSQTEIQPQEFKDLEERCNALVKALNDTPKPVLGAEPKPETHTVRKVIRNTVLLTAVAALVYFGGVFIGAKNGNEYCRSICRKINKAGIRLCDKVAYYAMRAAGLPPNSINRGMQNMLLPDDYVPPTSGEAEGSDAQTTQREPIPAAATPNAVHQAFAATRIGIHLPQDGATRSGAAAADQRQQQSAVWVVQDVTLAHAVIEENRALRENADAHMAEEIRYHERLFDMAREDNEKLKQKNAKLKAYIAKHGGDPTLHSINSAFEAKVSQEKQKQAWENGKSYGHYYGYNECKNQTQAEIDKAYHTGVEHGKKEGIRMGIDTKLDPSQMNLLQLGQARGLSAKQALMVDTMGQTDPPVSTLTETKTQTDPADISTYPRDNRIYRRGFAEGWYAGFNFGRSCEPDFMMGRDQDAYATYGRTNGLSDYATAAEANHWVEI